ncbi:MAG: hypothetical protein JRJ82_19995 [Deltaproteobacteria bacterium]|nr:hypothetical protein [Deltaproteobacteria bacterium]
MTCYLRRGINYQIFWWWVVIALFFVGMLGPMARYTITAFGPFISEELGWGATSIGLALSLSLWIYALVGIPGQGLLGHLILWGVQLGWPKAIAGVFLSAFILTGIQTSNRANLSQRSLSPSFQAGPNFLSK